jgi:phage terminase small subunit
MRPNLLRWQREGYPRYHRHRGNLVLHLFAVPAFIVASLCFAASILTGHLFLAALSLVAMAGAFALQGVGHGREETPSVPFEGPTDTVSRIFVEQFVTFPWFVLSGEWSRAYRGSGTAPREH